MLFGDDFLIDHAKMMVTDPKVAIMELIANSSDAGSLNVKITWPSKEKEVLKVEDDGIGLTYDEFMERWETLSFQRRKRIGNEVLFPDDISNPKPIRKLFGKSGKGRHSSFCFGDEYNVTTRKNGLENIFNVKKSLKADKPFDITVTSKNVPKEGHGTSIELVATKSLITRDELKEIVGSKFLMDPSFNVFINNEKIEFDDLSYFQSEILEIPKIGTAEIFFIDSTQSERSSRLRGLVWWVNNRMVSMPSWKNIISGKDHLDGRSKAAKKYGFVIKADFLDDHVDSDWLGFQNTENVKITGGEIDKFLQSKITSLLASARGEVRKTVIESNKDVLKDLAVTSQSRFVEFIDLVQQDCPTIKEDDLINTSRIFANLEKSRSGFDLLKQLANCSPDDLDRWNSIVSKWDSRCAQIVLDELDNRISLINELERLVHEKSTDELHELQPLFEKGLWIFGPQYETVEFQSNRTLKKIVENFLNGDSTKLADCKRRPDLITSPIGTWESNKYDEEGNVVGAERVLILELKKGGFTLKQKELDQARDYAVELKRSQAINDFTSIDCIVLGSKVDQYVNQFSIGEQKIVVSPRSYENVLRQANARVFNLRNKIEKLAKVDLPSDMKEILSQPELRPQY